MAGTHALLGRSRWQRVDLADLVRNDLSPYATPSNTTVAGPEVALNREAAEAMAMVLHELVTNAAKYGALSSPEGRVSVRWDWAPNDTQPTYLAMEWCERGGPKVVAPSQLGYGTSLICDLIPYELGGKVDLLFEADGVRCRIELPLERILWGSKIDSGNLLAPPSSDAVTHPAGSARIGGSKWAESGAAPACVAECPPPRSWRRSHACSVAG